MGIENSRSRRLRRRRQRSAARPEPAAIVGRVIALWARGMKSVDCLHSPFARRPLLRSSIFDRRHVRVAPPMLRTNLRRIRVRRCSNNAVSEIMSTKYSTPEGRLVDAARAARGAGATSTPVRAIYMLAILAMLAPWRSSWAALALTGGVFSWVLGVGLSTVALGVWRIVVVLRDTGRSRFAERLRCLALVPRARHWADGSRGRRIRSSVLHRPHRPRAVSERQRQRCRVLRRRNVVRHGHRHWRRSASCCSKLVVY